ncbi:hypothetical protein K0M31_003132 [Melipona bicolor]|uniref:Uncharacterized protein n=1 Tax=Melipona bicolor TaxID=60889 RepID=A0AA40G0G2_9HYME|nr:hypothetical protein K0M31_003132 [Melipona bicolor]
MTRLLGCEDEDEGVHGKQVGHDLVPREELAFADLGGTEIQTGGVRQPRNTDGGSRQLLNKP